MQDLNSQLMYFFSWLEELEQPIDSLKRETDSEAAMQDKEQVEIWLQQHGVSPAVTVFFSLWVACVKHSPLTYVVLVRSPVIAECEYSYRVVLSYGTRVKTPLVVKLFCWF